MASITELSLCGLEDLSDPNKALLFTLLSSPATKEDSAHLSLYATSGPGLSEQDPIVLVVEWEKRTVTVVKRNGQLVKLEFCQSVVRSFVYHSSRR